MLMNEQRLREITDRFAGNHVLVVGDFFLDRYLMIDSSLPSQPLVSGQTVRQVSEVLTRPNGAGAVAANLRAMGLSVAALGLVGDDGEGHELRQNLRALGVDDGTLLTTPGRRTPTQTRPIVRDADGTLHELEGLDIRSRTPISSHSEEALIARLRALAPRAKAVVIVDQIVPTDQGSISTRVRTALTQMVWQFPDTPVIADSRANIGSFARMMIKPSIYEAVQAVFPDHQGEIDLNLIQQAGLALRERVNDSSVFITLGDQGMLVVSDNGISHIPATTQAPTDTIQAGNTSLAALTAALCAGASPEEAAEVANLAAAVVLQQNSTTVSIAQIHEIA